MNSVIFVAIVVIFMYFGVATMRSYQANRKEPDIMDATMDPWDCPECGFHVQLGLVCIYCQTEKPDQAANL